MDVDDIVTFDENTFWDVVHHKSGMIRDEIACYCFNYFHLPNSIL